MKAEQCFKISSVMVVGLFCILLSGSNLQASTISGKQVYSEKASQEESISEVGKENSSDPLLGNPEENLQAIIAPEPMVPSKESLKKYNSTMEEELQRIESFKKKDSLNSLPSHESVPSESDQLIDTQTISSEPVISEQAQAEAIITSQQDAPTQVPVTEAQLDAFIDDALGIESEVTKETAAEETLQMEEEYVRMLPKQAEQFRDDLNRDVAELYRPNLEQPLSTETAQS